jgi:hypothetical protein
MVCIRQRSSRKKYEYFYYASPHSPYKKSKSLISEGA